MRFSKLRLTGFKSFVDPTDLIIADGLTGVVGPNGCGKSNLLEALRWVMGENRPTAMRGGGMEDVIFAGAATRPARNFAEVSLHIDNSERLAPAAFNQEDNLEIVRRITRDIGSAYKAAGKDVRARDVQMLFADASTGAHSPALVRQGQISELINAKPKARRRILEEAAGISGLYQRRHEAELKLKSAETNLARVDDVIETLVSQLSSLARQAKQAARYREIGTSLRAAEGLLLFRRWQDADEQRLASEQALKTRVTDAARAEAAVAAATTARLKAEEALPPLREEEAIAAALVQRLQVERAALEDKEAQARSTIETLSQRISQLERDIAREANLNRDAGGTIERLEEEASALVEASEGHEAKLQEAAASAREAGESLQVDEEKLAEKTEDTARLSARYSSAQRLVEDTQKTVTRAETEAQKANDAVTASRTSLATAHTVFEQAQRAAINAENTAKRAEETLVAAEDARAEAQAREADVRGELSEADGELNALRAEATALAKLVERDTAEGGHIMDRIKVAPGFEQALGAALADDLRAPEVEQGGPSGWLTLAAYDAAQPLPAGVAPLSAHVTGPEALARRLSQIGVVSAGEAEAIQPRLGPGQRIVSQEGDLWRWDGFRTRAEDAPSAAALRLQQMNRLEELKQSLEQATVRADAARAAHESLSKRLSDLTEADKQARTARREADRMVADAGRALNRAEADRNLIEGKLESLTLAVARHEDEAKDAAGRLQEAQKTLEELPDLSGARAEVETLRGQVEDARSSMMARRNVFEDLRRAGEARAKRAIEIEKEISSWRTRLETAATRGAELSERKDASASELKTAEAAPQDIAAQKEALGLETGKSESRLAKARDALSTGESTLRDASGAERDAERLASGAREDRAGAEARAEAAREAVTAAAERIAENMQVTPNQLRNQLDLDDSRMPNVDAIEAELNKLKRQRDALGAVNLRAEEDAKEVQEEHDLLVTEKADLDEAIKTLRNGIAGLNKEGRERLLTAFEQVNSNFSLLFRHLFGGGEANLVMVESDDPLEAGLEIMCQPPGKKLSTLSLLSGGEQPLTALALIFAVFLANPAPICVLDEVDAPLDDANVTRFCDLLDEMCRRTDTRFLIITHHAVTMARMDRLYGVTMAEQGVSQLVSVDLKKAETLVA